MSVGLYVSIIGYIRIDMCETYVCVYIGVLRIDIPPNVPTLVGTNVSTLVSFAHIYLGSAISL